MMHDPTDRERELRAQLGEAPMIPVDEFRARSRRSFLTGAAGVGAAYLGWQWLQDQPDVNGIPEPLRDTLEFNEDVWRTVSDGRSAPEHPISDATQIQVNGRIGIRRRCSPCVKETSHSIRTTAHPSASPSRTSTASGASNGSA